jgi:hypothetical protein
MEPSFEDDARDFPLGKPRSDDFQTIADFGLSRREIEHVEKLGRHLRRRASDEGESQRGDERQDQDSERVR